MPATGTTAAQIDEMKARAAEAGFGVQNVPANLLKGKFTDADERDFDPDNDNGLTGAAATVARQNAAAREASDDLNQIRQEELAGTRAGRITITGVVDKEKAAAQAREKARAEGDARMQAFLALQAQLDGLKDAANAWGKKVKGWEGERDKLLQTLLSPEEQALLVGLGEEEKEAAMREIMREKFERGDITQEKYNEFLELSEKIAEGKAKQAELGAISEDIQNAIDAGETPDLSKPLYDDAIAQYRAMGHDIDRTNATTEDVEKLLDFLTKSSISMAHTIEDNEMKVLTLADLEQYKGQPDYVEKIDAFIKEADKSTRQELLENDATPQDIRVRLRVADIQDKFERLQGKEGTPRYEKYMERMIGELDDATIAEALSDENIDQALKDEIVMRTQSFAERSDVQKNVRALENDDTQMPEVQARASSPPVTNMNPIV